MRLSYAPSEPRDLRASMRVIEKLAFSIWLVACTSLLAVAEDSPRYGSRFESTKSVRYPSSPFVVNIKLAPYFAKGDGRTDDTLAIQRALDDTMGQHKMLYFPKATYLVTKSLRWSKKNSSGQEAWGFNYLQGENSLETILKLQNETFTDEKSPNALMWCGGFGSADWFHNYVQDLTFDVGSSNPAAIGLQFYSNNAGAIRNCRFIGTDRSGLVGIDLVNRDMNGPLLVSNCSVEGFRIGVHTGNAVNSQTFEYLSLRGQGALGFLNEGQSISLRGLLSENEVPALQSYGTFCLIDAQLIGNNIARNAPAIINFNGGRIYLRNVRTSGYRRALGDVVTPDSAAAYRIEGADKPGTEGPHVAEYCSNPPTTTSAMNLRSLGLAIEDPPEISMDVPGNWANVDDYGADPTGSTDSSVAIQRAFDSGASTIFLPGSYACTKTILVRGNVQRVVGVGGAVDYNTQVKPDFRISDGASPAIVFEHFGNIHGGIEIDSSRTVYLRSIMDCNLTFTERSRGGKLFLEDVVTHELKLGSHKTWGRQVNVENEGTHVVNDGGDLWLLGFKTERGGTLIQTTNGGRSEVLGGFSYTTTAGRLAPMFVNDNSAVFTFFAEVCFNGDPYQTLIREIRGSSVKEFRREDGSTTPYVGVLR